MNLRTLTIEHDGTTYYGHIATVKRTMLGQEDHGINTAFLFCEWGSASIGIGGYFLDKPRDPDSYGDGREGTALGMDQILRFIETVGVNSWEDLAGSSTIVLFDGPSPLGARAVGIAGLHNDKVLILKEHADEWRERESARSEDAA